jgi:ATP-dependent RNA helicase DeaD
MLRYRVEVGHQHSVKPGNIVGAIANEAGLDAEHIGRIDIQNDYSLVDLPTGMPRDVLHDLRKARVCGQRLDIALLGGGDQKSTSGDKRPTRKPKPAGKTKAGRKKTPAGRKKTAHKTGAAGKKKTARKPKKKK